MKNLFRRALWLFLIVVVVTRAHLRASAEDYIAFLDMSTSMAKNNKLLNAGAGLNLFAAVLQDDDSLTVVAFNDSSVVHGPFSMATDRHQISDLTAQLKALGGTDYLQALRHTPEQLNAGVGVFLSDGAHQGRTDEVLDYVERNLAGDLALHTIAVGCPPESPAEQLLSRMAAITDASYSRVESSENLVRQFLHIALQSGSYRGFEPAEDEITLDGLRGTLLSFAYDAEVSLSTAIDRQHSVRLPGESVSVAVSRPPAGDPVTVRLVHSVSDKARLGAVFTSGLPEHRLRIENKRSTYVAGTTLNLTLSFIDPRNQRVVTAHPQASVSVELLDNRGVSIQQADLQNAASLFRGTLELPGDAGTLTLVVHSEWPVNGKPFLQTSETTIVVDALATPAPIIEPPVPKPAPPANPAPPAPPKEWFEASENGLRFTVKPRDVADFELTVRPLSSHTGSTEIGAEFQAFTLNDNPVANVLTNVNWHPSATLRGTKGQVKLSGSILSPNGPGTYHSCLKLTGRQQSVSIPIELIVHDD